MEELTQQWTENWIGVLEGVGIRQPWAGYAGGLVLLFVVVALAFVLHWVTRRIVLRLVSHYIQSNRFSWDNKMLERKVFSRMSHIVPALVLYRGAGLFPVGRDLIAHGAVIYLLVVIAMTINAFLNALDDIYRCFEISKERPIKGYLQVLKIVVFTLVGILIIARLIGENPLYILGGFGAMAAVLLLIFQDSILGLVAGIQLAANDMVRLGDWIEMPKYGADGDVVDITLNTVKVENFDRTITTIPTYALVRDSFKNWRGIQEAGGRRIMRSVKLDLSSVGFCTDEQLDRLKEIRILRDYIDEKQAEIRRYNEERGLANTHPANGRRLTNIGVFRVYLGRYLDHHPGIHQSMIKMVRLMAPGEDGVALEVYGFTNKIDWISFESIQADIFDHILAVVGQFGLRLYQHPSGADLTGLRSSLLAGTSEGMFTRMPDLMPETTAQEGAGKAPGNDPGNTPER